MEALLFNQISILECIHHHLHKMRTSKILSGELHEIQNFFLLLRSMRDLYRSYIICYEHKITVLFIEIILYFVCDKSFFSDVLKCFKDRLYVGLVVRQIRDTFLAYSCIGTSMSTTLMFSLDILNFNIFYGFFFLDKFATVAAFQVISGARC